MKKLIISTLAIVFSMIVFLSCNLISEEKNVTEENNLSEQQNMQVKNNLSEPSSFSEQGDLLDGLYAKIITTKGEILAKLEFEKAPMTVGNFVGLAEGKIENKVKALGVPFYDGIIFHRVIPNFMIQTGDPQGNGTGGPGYKFPDEFHPDLKHQGPGILSMANSGPATNGSQFFITHNSTPHLNNKHSVFGKVIKGQDVVVAIGNAPKGANDRPNTEIKIEKIEIIRVGKKAKEFDGAAVFEDKRANYAKEQAEKAAKEKEKAAKDLSDFMQKAKASHPNLITLESGLMIAITKKGTGPKPKNGQRVGVAYKGMFPSGKVFDTSIEAEAKANNMYNERRQYVPYEFPLGQGQVIKGWDLGVAEMNQGSKATLYVPYHLAYGERGYPGAIPPYSNLIFEVELASIK